MRRLLLVVLVPLLLGAGPPVPSGTATVSSTDPVTIDVDYSKRVNPNRYVPYVLMSCTQDGWVTLSYEAYESARTSPVVFDEDVWILRSGTVPVGTCQAWLILQESGRVEIVLDYVEPFEV